MSHKLVFRERGAGAPILLLHGYGGSVWHWDQVAENLKSSCRVIIPNLSHIYMGSDKIFFSIQVEVLADFIRANFPHEKVSVAGMSYGGALAWALSVQHPELVDNLILVNPVVPNPVPQFSLAELRYFFVIPLNLTSIYFLLSTPIGRAFLNRSAAIFRDERAEGAVNVQTLKGRRLMFVAHLIHRFSWLLRTADWRYWKRKLPPQSASVLFIYDSEDTLFSKEVYKNFARELAALEVVELNGAGHLATKTRPEAISSHIANFMNRTEKKVSA